jgi:hypothetical protein
VTSIALIACDNGLGHLRRVGILARELSNRGARVSLFGPIERLNSFRAWPGLDSFADIELQAFHTWTSAEFLRHGDALATRWVERLPDMDGYDVVVSDNLPEILMRRPDAVLCGHFLWHDALKDIAADYRRRALELMDRHRPPIIATTLFAAPTLERQARVIPVGLFRAGPPVAGVARNNLLLSAGTGNAGPSGLNGLVSRLVTGERTPFDRVYLEPRLRPLAAPAWFEPAAYTPGMYAQTLAAICRPGVGTLTDCLLSGVRVFAIQEPGNDEMSVNVERLQAAGIGGGFDDAGEAYEAALSYRHDIGAQRGHENCCRTLPDTGAQEAADWLLRSCPGPEASVRDAESRSIAR